LLGGQTFVLGKKEGKGRTGSGKKPSFLWDNHSGLVLGVKEKTVLLVIRPLEKRKNHILILHMQMQSLAVTLRISRL